MATSTAYSNYIYDSTPIEYKVDASFIKGIADTQSKMFEQSYAKIEGFKSKVLNLSTLNPYANEKIDNYNKKIGEYFKTNDLKNANLSNQKIVNGFMSVFNEIDNDTELQGVYKKSEELTKVNSEFKEALTKDKQVQDNYLVWQKEHLEGFSKESNLGKASQANSGSFNPYYDYTKEISGIKNQLHFDGVKYSIKDGKGGMQTFDKKELAADKLKGAIDGFLSGAAVNQLMTEGKARFYQNPNYQTQEGINQLREDLYKEEKGHLDLMKNNYKEEIKQLEGKRIFLQAKSNKTEQEQQLLDSIPNSIGQRELAIQGLPQITLNDFNKRSYLELAQYAGINHKRNKIQTLANKMAWQETKITEELDKGFWKGKDFSLDVMKENNDTKFREEELKLRQNEQLRKWENDKMDFQAATQKTLKKDGTIEMNNSGLPLIETDEAGTVNKSGIIGYAVTDEDKKNVTNGTSKTIDSEISNLQEIINLGQGNITENDILKSLKKPKHEMNAFDVMVRDKSLGYDNNHSLLIAVKDAINKPDGDFHGFISEVWNKKAIYEDIKNRAYYNVKMNNPRFVDMSNEDYQTGKGLSQEELTQRERLVNYEITDQMNGTISKKKIIPSGEKYKPAVQKVISALNSTDEIKNLGFALSDDMIDTDQLGGSGNMTTFNFKSNAFKDNDPNVALNGKSMSVKTNINFDDNKSDADATLDRLKVYRFQSGSKTMGTFFTEIKLQFGNPNLKTVVVKNSKGEPVNILENQNGTAQEIKQKINTYINNL